MKEGFTLRNRYFTALSSSSMRMIGIDTNLMIIITSTADELSGGTNIGDLQVSK